MKGSTKLSIIDSQLFYNDDKNIVIDLNGEIYNYKTLKTSLEKEGICFKTNSDMEVILRLYEKHGIDSFSSLDGMFTFSIYDKKNKKIIIVRDFFGGKPLYYYKTTGEFYWASELKDITSVIDRKTLTISETALNLYFRLTYIPAPYSIYKDIFKLEPNTFLEYDLNTKCITKKLINQPSFDFDLEGINEEKAIKICFEKVCESVIARSISDAPVGTFLSGGVDSSVVSWCLAKHTGQKIDTFSIGFENKQFDESEKAMTVAKLINSNHHLSRIDERDLFSDIDTIILNFDEPYADSSLLASYFVAQKAKAKIKVALTGDGGDEVFGGYNKYYIGKLNNTITSLLPESVFNIAKGMLKPILYTQSDKRGKRYKLRRLFDSIDYDNDFYYKIISLGFAPEELKKILLSYNDYNFGEYKSIDKPYHKYKINDFREIDRHLSLDGDMLVKVDRTNLLTSLEFKSPLLNRDLWNFTNNLPDNYLIRGYNKKYILKKSFEKYFPTGFFDIAKQGFQVPVGNWLRNSLKKELESYCDLEFLKTQGIFNPERLIPLITRHIQGKQDSTFEVWTYYCFQKWYKKFYL